jgi:site-specific DNA-methyltransferase (adenine-specific)
MIELLNKVYSREGIDLMGDLPDGCVDLMVVDPPYGMTNNPWDKKLIFSQFWPEAWRVLKHNGPVVMFAAGKFAAEAMLSSKYYRYDLVWDKQLVSGFLNANRMPLRVHEWMLVFYRKMPTYNPQKWEGLKKSNSMGRIKSNVARAYKEVKRIDNRDKLGKMKHPRSILSFQKPHPSVGVHSTEKPVELIEWVIKSFSNPGDTVLDPCCGSGTTGEACINTGRDFILSDLSPYWAWHSCERTRNAFINKSKDIRS